MRHMPTVFARYSSIPLLILLLMFIGISSVIAAETRPKVGLILGGGGAAGVAHVGVLKVLEEHNIPVDMIAGTSMGAIVGGLYASGMSADELEKTVKSLEWLSLFDDSQPRENQQFHQKQANSGFFGSFELGWQDRKLRLPSGLVTGQKLMFELRRLFTPVSHVQNFDQLPIPFRAVATDIETGEAVILDKGNLPQVVRASMAIPGMFSPVKIDGRLLVDGFVANNVPVSVAREMGADILIVVNIPTFLEQQEELGSAVSVAMQAMQLMMLKSSKPQLEKMQPQDILIEPGIRDIGNLDFDRVEETIPLGVQAALGQLQRLQRLAVSAQQQQRLDQTRKQARRISDEVRIARIEFNNESGLSDELLQKYLGVQAGDRLDEQALQRGLENIYGLGEFDLVDHNLIRQADGGYVLQVNAVGNSAGNRRLRFGLALSDDFEGNTEYQFGVRRITRGFNDRGSEWRNSLIIGDTLRFESEFYQPVPERDMFVESKIHHEQSDFYFYQDEDRLAEVRGREIGMRVDMGKEFGNWGEARAGLFYSYIKPDVTTGQIELPDRVRTGGVRFQYQTDTMDDDLIPSQGRRFSAAYTHNSSALGSDRDANRLELSAARAWSADPHRLLLSAEAGTTFTDEGLLVERLSLGGLGRMSGLADNQLAGNHLLHAGLVYMRELSDVGGIAQFYVGGSVEAGNVWTQNEDVAVDDLLLTGSVFVGADTPLGPAFVGIAQTEGYDTRPFLYVGQGF